MPAGKAKRETHRAVRPPVRGGFLTAVGLLALAALGASVAQAQESDIPDAPRLRWEHFYQQRAFPFSTIPGGALQRAQAQLAAIAGGFAAIPPPIQGTTWVPFGPERIPTGQTSTGRLTAIAVHPHDSNILYVGGAQGGVWKTTNGGESWVPLTDEECSLAMGSIALDPVDPQIVYAGTGEQHFSGDSYYGCGVLRSEDGGASWVQLGQAVFVRTGASNARISRIDLDPRTAGSVAGATLLAASDFGLFRSTNGGVTWTSMLEGIATDLVRDPTNPDVLYTAIRRTGVFKSVDGGLNWTQLSSGFPTQDVSRINLALAPSAPLTLFAAIQSQSESNLLGIWKTTDGGGSWTALPSSAASCGSQCWYNMTIAVHPTDPNTVYFGGVSLFKSTNGGVTFSDIRRGIHVDQHHLVFDPRDPEVVFVGNDGGIYRSPDGGGSWVTLNTNLALTQFYAGISLHPWDARVSLGGTQDNGTVQSDGTFDFDQVLGGDGGFTAIDFLDPTYRFAETQWVADVSYSGPRRSDGSSFLLKVTGIDRSERALFIPPLVMDPVDPEKLYFGTVRLYRTEDRGESWQAISPQLPGPISAIAPALSTPGVVYVGTGNGSAQRTTDGGGSWTEIISGLPTRHIKDIAVDPLDWRRAFLVVSGFASGHVFRTTDGGASWQDVSSNLPDVPVNAVLMDPAQPNTLFIGTDLGVFVSADAGGTWTVLGDGLPNVAVFDLAYNASTGVLMAATHGRGMFFLTLERALTMAVLPGARADSTLLGSEQPLPDSATVILTGTGAAVTPWTATHGAASWLTLISAGGTGTGRLHWTRDPTGLVRGLHVDTIRVTAPGAIDSPFELVDSLLIDIPLTLAVDAESRLDTAYVGDAAPRYDSAAVTLSGLGSGVALWEATHGAAAWLAVTTAGGQGSGMLRWTRNPAGLGEGTYVDTLAVSTRGASGTPASIVDTMVLVPPPLALEPDFRSGSTWAGSLDPLPDSARIVLGGAGAGTAQWSAVVSPTSWISLTTASGTGPGMLRWERNPTGLRLGVHQDTITVTSTNQGLRRLVDVLTLVAPQVPTVCAVDHLFGTPCLSELQLRFLDLEGNRDSAYNLGDFLAQLARANQGGTPEGGR